MLLVLSPAKSLDFESPIPPLEFTQPELLSEAQTLAAQLQRLSPVELSQLMGISDKLSELNYNRYQAWHPPFTPSNARPAVLTFAGDVYLGLAAPTFTSEDFRFAQRHLRILSGLYGILRPLDLIQPYRLEMGTRLGTARGRNLYAFWGNRITDQINGLIETCSVKTVVNLASQEYFKSVNPRKLEAPVIEPVFKDYKNGRYKTISFFAKRARGLMSAYAIRNRLSDAADLKSFDSEGYRFSPRESTATQWIFTRKI